MKVQASTILISEKNKAARTIAEALGPVLARRENGVPVYEVPSRDLVVVALRGHLKGYRNVGPYEKWNQRDPRDIIVDPNAIAKRVLPGQAKIRDLLNNLGRQCSACIVGTDADLEGCNIGIVDALPEVRRGNPRIKVSQLWLHTLQKGDIVRAFGHLVPPKYSWADAAETRAILDAVIGFSATREVTLTLQQLARALGTKVLSIGRVQTSLLYLLFLRERGIRNFQPKPYWTITSELDPGGAGVGLSHVDNPFHDRKACEETHARVKDEVKGLLEDFSSARKKRHPPKPLNTTKALLLLTRHLRVTSSRALKLMEDLYLDQLVSYPRTDSDRYAPGFDHVQYLKKLANHGKYGSVASGLLRENRTRPTEGRLDAGDHSPITPVASIPLSSPKLKSPLHRGAYDLLVRHYLALFSPPATEVHGKLVVDVAGEKFQGSLSALVDPGFLAVLPELSPKYSRWVPLQAGREYLLGPVDMSEKETQPPPRFTDTTVIQLMERNGLGTKSTRPAIVEILLKRGYLGKRARAFFVTDLGYNLMENLEPIWRDFLLPNFTARVEKRLEAIKEGSEEIDQVLAEMKREFLELFDLFRANKAKFVANMQSTRVPVAGVGKNGRSRGSSSTKVPVKCPSCGADTLELVHTRNRKRFIKCTANGCGFVLFFPKRGSVSLLKSKRCELCGFTPVRISTRIQGRPSSYYICPRCWNRGLREKIPDLGFCSKCPKYVAGTCDIKPRAGKRASKGGRPGGTGRHGGRGHP
ncbi:MAG: DNA topoisomerase [Promethearchaeota archaeon]